MKLHLLLQLQTYGYCPVDKYVKELPQWEGTQEPAFLHLVFIQQEPDCGVTLSLHPHMPSCHFLNDFFQTVWDSVRLFPQKFLSDCIPRKKVKGRLPFLWIGKNNRCYFLFWISNNLFGLNAIETSAACCFTCIPQAVLFSGERNSV